MFGIDFPELLVIAVLALVVLGPEKLSEYATKLGHFVARMRRASAEVTQPLQAAWRPDLTPPPSPTPFSADNFCPHCSLPLSPEFAFCPRCGRRLEKEVPSSQPLAS